MAGRALPRAAARGHCPRLRRRRPIGADSVILLTVADLLLGLGAAVVKVACKIWLKDDQFAADAGADVVDVIAGKVADDLEQRHARRLFEDLEVPVAKKLGALRQQEFAGIPDNEWQAAVLAAGDALRRARFTDSDVFEGDLDPLYLRAKVTAAATGLTRDLSDAGTALYERLLTECCSYVVELTSTLPRFSAGAFAEILRRQSAILQRVTEVLDRMPAAGSGRAGAGQPEADFTAAYRRQAVSQLDRLELFGVTVSEAVRGYPLSTAYIPLAISSDSLRPAGQLEAGLKAGGDLHGGAPGASGMLSIDRALATTSRLFLRGEAGSGKTTMLQWLAVRAARQDFPEWLASWNDALPFLIRLRRSAGQELPPPEAFVNEVGRHIAAEMPPRWVHGLLREGRALILVDGVDELPEGQRRAARDWLSGLINAFPDARYVVTSRPGAASATWLDRQGFDHAEVQPMGWPDVQEFVRHWHAAFCAESADQDRHEQLGAAESALLESLYARRHLRLLATSPLLSALLCALNLDRRAQLPDERMELYAIALDMLLERRDTERQITSGGPPFSKTAKTLLLEDLAYWLIRNGWSDTTRDRAAERLAWRLSAMPRAGTQDGAQVLDGLVVRSGLIREPVVGRIDFVHRTFQEYLAASAAISQDEVGELIRNAHDDQWREVIVMAAGHAQPRQRDELLHGILARADGEPPRRQLLQTLAVACLETSPQLDPVLHGQIQAVAASLLPPKGMRQAEILARLGEPLLDLLAGRPPRGKQQTAATIRAASMVGGEAALKVIARCAQTDGRFIRDELMRAWPQFNAEEFACTVLSDSPCATLLIISYPPLLPALPRIRRLRRLILQFPDPKGHGDLAVIRNLPRLGFLNIAYHVGAVDLSPLTGHPALEHIIIQGPGQPVDITPLITIPSLDRIFFNADSIQDIEPLRSCAGLRSVSLMNFSSFAQLPDILPPQPLEYFCLVDSHLENLTPLIPVPQLVGLENLSLVGCDSRSLQGIERWVRTLRSLTIWDADPALDFDALEGLSGLIALNIDTRMAEHLDVVHRLSALRDLYLFDRSSKVDTVDISALRGKEGLTVHARRGLKIRGADALGKGSRVARS